MIANVEKNIEKGKKEIAQLEHKLQVINSILHENKWNYETYHIVWFC